MLSRLAMSICATSLILCLAPWFVASMESADDDLAERGLQELSLVLTGAMTSAHPLHIVVHISDYLASEGACLHLEKGSIWLVHGAHRKAQAVPSQFTLFLVGSGMAREVQSSDLTRASVLTIVRESADGGELPLVYIENLDATSFTASEKRSTSSSPL